MTARAAALVVTNSAARESATSLKTLPVHDHKTTKRRWRAIRHIIIYSNAMPGSASHFYLPEILSVLSIEDNMSFIGSTLRMYLAVCLVMGEGVQWLG